MMVSNEMITRRNEEHMVKLTEDDIAGAKVTGVMGEYTMSKLKWSNSVKGPNL